MSFAADIRHAIDAQLAAYEAAEGSGPDAYHAAAQSHPMADGKYLAVLAILENTGLVSAAQAESKRKAALSRLAAAALDYQGGAAWGLGFTWRDLPASEPFLITTAIVAAHLPQGDLQQRARAALLAWPQQNGVRLYSPGIAEPITNAAAAAAAAVGDSAFLAALPAQFTPHAGWIYAPHNPIIDLLHQAYILQALDAATAEPFARQILGQFAGATYIDGMRLHTTLPPPSDRIPLLRTAGTHWLEIHPAPARLWSLGEWLRVCVSLIPVDPAWQRVAQSVAQRILQRLADPADHEASYPRHSMHALHGLAALLAQLRAK